MKSTKCLDVGIREKEGYVPGSQKEMIQNADNSPYVELLQPSKISIHLLTSSKALVRIEMLKFL